jgi:hypothetical protein
MTPTGSTFLALLAEKDHEIERLNDELKITVIDEKDAEIERLKVELEVRKAMRSDAASDEAEIELLQKRVLEFVDLNIANRKLIAELAEALDSWQAAKYWDWSVKLLQRAREATK